MIIDTTINEYYSSIFMFLQLFLYQKKKKTKTNTTTIIIINHIICVLIMQQQLFTSMLIDTKLWKTIKVIRNFIANGGVNFKYCQIWCQVTALGKTYIPPITTTTKALKVKHMRSFRLPHSCLGWGKLWVV